MTLKIKPAVKPPEMVKVSLNLPSATAQLLKAYAKAYLEDYGAEADEDYIVNAILIAFLESDKTFKKFLHDHPEITEELQGHGVKKTRKPRQKKTPEAGTV